MRVMTADENEELLRLHDEFMKVEQALFDILKANPRGPLDSPDIAKRWRELLDELDRGMRAFTDTQRAYLRGD